MIDYNVISSGSHGNAVRIDTIMIDCGVPYKHLERDLYKVDYLLITHTHSDHLKKATINKIRKLFPHIKVAGNYEVAYETKVDHITAHYNPIQMGDWKVIPFPCVHDVLTQGFVLEKNKTRILYATDTAIMDNAPKGPYDMLFLESNHDENKISQVRGSNNYGYDVWRSAQRHLSTQKAKAFYFLNRRNKESPWIELHISRRFY